MKMLFFSITYLSNIHRPQETCASSRWRDYRLTLRSSLYHEEIEWWRLFSLLIPRFYSLTFFTHGRSTLLYSPFLLLFFVDCSPSATNGKMSSSWFASLSSAATLLVTRGGPPLASTFTRGASVECAEFASIPTVELRTTTIVQ